MLTKRCSKTELIELIQDSLTIFLPHVFIAKQQSNYLKTKKENLKTNEALVILDFSENYKYVVQDDIQQRYWPQTAITVHPVVIYVKEDGKVINKNLCFFTEDLKHDVPVVKVFVAKILDHIKKEFPKVENIEFFSDGCGAQYKNSEIFSYLPDIQEKFKIDVKWNFCHITWQIIL